MGIEFITFFSEIFISIDFLTTSLRKIKIDFNKHNLEEKINNAREAFNKEYYLEYELDLSRLNLIDASKIALLLPAELMKKNTKS